MKTKFFFLMLTLFLSGAALTVNAQIKEHQKVQEHRIKNGVKSGELTKGETKVLQHREREVRQDKKLAKSDGKITKPERKMIRKEQKRNSKLIHKAKHNNKTRKP